LPRISAAVGEAELLALTPKLAPIKEKMKVIVRLRKIL
jgi:hypothetical protein